MVEYILVTIYYSGVWKKWNVDVIKYHREGKSIVYNWHCCKRCAESTELVVAWPCQSVYC